MTTEQSKLADCTDEMVRAGREAHHKHGCGAVREIYTAMLRAAPSPDTRVREALDRGHLTLHERFIEGRSNWCVERIFPERRVLIYSFGSDRLRAEKAFRAALTALTQPGAVETEKPK